MTNYKSLAPIALFAFNRPKHLARTVEALKSNELAKKTIVYAFVDGIKNKSDFQNNELVKDILYKTEGFKKIIIIERNKNLGLAKNIVDGINYVFDKSEKIIVLEDDIETNRFFLSYMNQALDYYEDSKKVWHISSYNDAPLDSISEDIIFWRGMNCWGWGTWKDRWCEFEKNPQHLKKTFTKKIIRTFNFENTQRLWSQVEENYNGDIDTWAVFWYATIFLNNGLSVVPKLSLSNNFGFDGSGTNCNISTQKTKNLPLTFHEDIKFTDEILEKDYIVEARIKYYKSIKKNIIRRIINRFKRVAVKK